MSELGDKTFFIAALLAMRVGRAIAFFGSVISLGFMTVISVGIGLLFAQVPQFIDQSSSVGQYIGAALLAYFGMVLHLKLKSCDRWGMLSTPTLSLSLRCVILQEFAPS